MFRQSSAGRAVLVIAGAWLFLFWLGHPLAFVDDLFFAGPAINLAQGHGFYNPYCPAIGVIDPRPEFFVYMPFQGYVLAGWLKLFGVSREALAGFQCLAAALATFGLWLATRRFSDSLFLPLGLVACVAVFLGSSGLRPEAMGLALLVWGWVLLEKRSLAAWFIGGLFLTASVFTSPNIGMLAPVAGAWAIVRSFRAETRVRLAVEIGFLGVGAAVAFLLFLTTIHFDLVRFVAVFNAARHESPSFMNPGLLESLTARPVLWRDAARALLQIVEPLAMLVAVLALVFFRRGLFEVKPGSLALGFLLVGAGLLLVPELSSAQGKIPLGFYAIVACLVLAANVRVPFRLYAISIWISLFLIFLFGFGHRTLQLLGRPHLPPAQAEALRQSVTRLSPAPLFIDEFAVAAVFDYKMPAHGLDYHFGVAGHFGTFDPRQFPPGSFLVVSKETLVRARAWQRYNLGPSPALMPLIGPFFTVKLADPYAIVIVPGGDAR